MERPVTDRWRRWRVGDLALIVGLAAVGVAGHAAALDDPTVEAAPLTVPIALLAMVAPVVLWWRREHPLAMFAALVVPSVLAGLLDDVGLFGVQIGLIVMVLSHAAGAWAQRVGRAAILIAVLVLLFFSGAVADGSGALGAAALATAVLAFPFALGLAARQRRDYLEQVEGRLADAERDRDERARRAIADERTRIARELHDVVAHHVSLIGVQASAARTALDRSPDDTRRALSSIEASSRDAVSEMRHLLDALRPLDESQPTTTHAPEPGLDRLDHLAGTWREAGYDIGVANTVAGPLSPALSTACFRIVEESLTNISRHSQARAASVEVSLDDAESEVVLRITDPGPAAESPDGPGTGHGLVGIRERVSLFGGSLTTGPLDGGGFGVEARLPARP